MRKSKKSFYKPKWDEELRQNFSDIEISRLADEMLDWISARNEESTSSNFWLNDFAASKMLSQAQLKSFAVKNEYFNKIYEICKSIQESKLLKMALYKEVNATPAVFILKSLFDSGENNTPVDKEEAKKQVEEIFEQ